MQKILSKRKRRKTTGKCFSQHRELTPLAYPSAGKYTCWKPGPRRQCCLKIPDHSNTLHIRARSSAEMEGTQRQWAPVLPSQMRELDCREWSNSSLQSASQPPALFTRTSASPAHTKAAHRWVTMLISLPTGQVRSRRSSS